MRFFDRHYSYSCRVGLGVNFFPKKEVFSMDEMITYLNCFEKLITYNNRMVEAIGDCPNLEIRVTSDSPFWKTVKSIGDWKCQRIASQTGLVLCLWMKFALVMAARPS